MAPHSLDRRDLVAGAALLGGFGALPTFTAAQDAAPHPGTVATAPTALPARDEFVVRRAKVLTMDPHLAELDNGDVHVRDGVIIAVGNNLEAPGAEVIDGSGMLCIPGFVDTHWHLWTSLLRPVIRADDTRYGYFPVTARLGEYYRPEDSYRAVRLGLAEALSAGATTVHNWAHNVRSPSHADAELRAMRDSGIRGRFSYGYPQGSSNTQPMDIADLARVVREWTPNDGMLTLGICSRNVGRDPNPLRGNITTELAKKEWNAARELGLRITLHTSGPSVVKLLDEAGLLGPDVQLVHPLLTDAEDRAILVKRDTSYSMSPIGELRRPASAGDTQLGELLEAGVRVSFSIDNITTYDCDYFGIMRTAYSTHLHRLGDRIKLTSRRLVEIATIGGARDLGLSDKIGSLTPGKRADLILIRMIDPNLVMMGDPYEALVSLAQPANVDTVVVDGRILRRGGRFTSLDHAQIVQEAKDSARDLRTRAAWPS
jgi:5-methylthioadenosine/S-adenosylhomocysteine deaminase